MDKTEIVNGNTEKVKNQSIQFKQKPVQETIIHVTHSGVDRNKHPLPGCRKVRSARSWEGALTMLIRKQREDGEDSKARGGDTLSALTPFMLGLGMAMYPLGNHCIPAGTNV